MKKNKLVFNVRILDVASMRVRTRTDTYNDTVSQLSRNVIFFSYTRFGDLNYSPPQMPKGPVIYPIFVIEPRQDMYLLLIDADKFTILFND